VSIQVQYCQRHRRFHTWVIPTNRFRSREERSALVRLREEGQEMLRRRDPKLTRTPGFFERNRPGSEVR
jgi:hypothetical protein